MAPALLWNNVRLFFEPETMGCLPDLGVPETSTDDWQTLLDLVVSSTWRFEYTEGDTILPLPRAEAVFSRHADAESASLGVWMTSRVVAIFRFYAPEQIDFDVDLREIEGQEALDAFCGFVSVIGPPGTAISAPARTAARHAANAAPSWSSNSASWSRSIRAR
jgi:hypothetical protein